MRLIFSQGKSPVNDRVLFSTAILLSLTVGGWVVPAQAQTKVVLSQVTQVGAYPSAGGLSGGNPAGSTMGVNQQGLVIFGNSYGTDVLELNPATGVVTTLGAPGNVGAVAIDAQNNYYFANEYGSTIVKIPYVNGAYAASNASPTAKCVGNDTAACTVQGLTVGANGYYFGVLSMTFDAAGDLFFGLTNGNTAPNAIFECTAACTTGNGGATLLYQEPTNAAAQLTIGGMAADAYGNLFFTDSAETSAQLSTVSNVNELVYTIGPGFAAKPVVLYTETPVKGATPNDQIDAVNIDANGVVYFATTYTGVFAFPTTKGVVNTAGMYAVSNQGAKVMATDGKGNFYVDNNITSGDVIDLVALGNIVTPTAWIGKSSTATNVTTVVNDSSCTSSPTLTFAATENGTATTEFSAATTGTCTAATLGSSGSFATTVTFTPTASGTRTATLTATDNSKNAAVATVTGVGTNQPAAATPTFQLRAGRIPPFRR
jgi:hypothetical protein